MRIVYLFAFVLFALFVLPSGNCKKSTPPAPPPTPVNLAPIARAGADQILKVAMATDVASVSLNGSGSTDADGSITTYAWRIVSGPTGAAFSAASSSSTNLTNMSKGDYIIELKVTDNQGATHTDEVAISIIWVEAPTPFGFYVVGYIPSYRDPSSASIADNKFRMCNVINYAFASVTASGGVTLASPANLTTVVTRAAANNCKVMLSLNGATTDWKNMATTVTGRTSFINQVMNLVRQYNLQGVDVDWEFPTTADGTDQLFTDLMKQFSDSCHRDKKYYLTAAITAGKYAGGIRDAVRSEIFPFVDFFNVMAYDDFSTTVAYKHHSDYTLAQTCLNYWITTRGLPASKCVLGIPAYARPSGITQSGTISTYAQLITANAAAANTDSAIVASMGSFTNFTTYYNGQPTVKRKTMLAKNMANGVMFWEHGQDRQDNYSLIKAACDTLNRPY
jgi:chitinase